MKQLIKIGTSKKTVKEAGEVIVRILEANVGETPKIEALKTLATICNVNNTAISGCTLKEK